jgi:hypothetical protein
MNADELDAIRRAPEVSAAGLLAGGMSLVLLSVLVALFLFSF